MMNTFLRLLSLVLLVAFVFTSTVGGEMFFAPNDSVAYAAKKKKKKKSKKGKKGKQSKEQSSDDEMAQALGEGDGKKSGQVDVAKLHVENDVRLTSRVGQKIDESIDKLFLILEKFQEPTTFRRLAEFYWKKASRLQLDAMQEHSKVMDEWMQAGQKGKPPKEPDPVLWNRYNNKAIEVCQLVEERWPDFDGMDEIYFFMAFNYNEVGKSSEGLVYYKRITEQFPNSAFLPDTWMAIGDYYFNNNNVYDAQPAYEEVLKFKDNKAYGYALYKIAWCHYNLSKFRDSIDAFKAVVIWSDEMERMGKSNIQLKEESLKDLVMAYAEEGAVDEAEKYFLEVGGKKYFRMMLVRFATILNDQGKTDGAIKIYRRLIQEWPLHKENPDYQIKIVEGFTTKGDKEATTQEILNLVEFAKPPEESKWVAHNIKKEPETVEEAWKSAENMLIKTVVTYHKEALKINDEGTWDKTQELYDTYIKYFGKSEKNYDVHWNYAELLWRRAENAEQTWKKSGNPESKAQAADNMRMRYHRAGEMYTKVVEMQPKGVHVKDATYNAILAYEKLVHEEIAAWVTDTKKRSTRKDKNYELSTEDAAKQKEQEAAEALAPRKISDNTAGFLKACGLYIQNVDPTNAEDRERMVNIIYKSAIIYYAHNMFDEAVGRFDLIVQKYPKHRLAEYAANLILDSLNIKQRWGDLNQTVRAYLKNKALVSKAKFREDLENLLEKSSFKMIELTEQDKKWRQAAEEYLAFDQEFGKKSPHAFIRKKGGSKHLHLALYNAAVHYVSAGDLFASIEVQKRFLEEHKTSPYYEEIFYKLGRNYEALAFYDKAADQYEQYLKKFPKPKDAEYADTALTNGALFFEVLGQPDKSETMRKAYMSKLKTEKQKDGVRFRLALMWLDHNKPEKAEKALREYVKSRERDITWPKMAAAATSKKGKKDEKPALAGAEKVDKRGKIKGDPNNFMRAHLELRELYIKFKNQKSVDEMDRKIYQLYYCDLDADEGWSRESRDAIAEVHFKKLAPAFEEYKQIRLEVKNRGISQDKWNTKLLEALQHKTNMSLQMVDAYNSLVNLGSARWAVASQYMVGMVYKYFSLSWFQSEVPYWLTIDQEMIYQDGLQAKAKPLEDQAILAWERALSVAYEKNVYSQYIAMARKELAGYRPIEYQLENDIKRGLDSPESADLVISASFVEPDLAAAPEPPAKPKPRPATVPGQGATEGEQSDAVAPAGADAAPEAQAEPEAAAAEPSEPVEAPEAAE